MNMKERLRNQAFDALALIDGIPPTEKVGKSEAGRVSKALSVIREITPAVTAEQIAAAAQAYRDEWPNVTMTSTALAKHWRRFFSLSEAQLNFSRQIDGIKAEMAQSSGNRYMLLQNELEKLESMRTWRDRSAG